MRHLLERREHLALLFRDVLAQLIEKLRDAPCGWRRGGLRLIKEEVDVPEGKSVSHVLGGEGEVRSGRGARRTVNDGERIDVTGRSTQAR